MKTGKDRLAVRQRQSGGSGQEDSSYSVYGALLLAKLYNHYKATSKRGLGDKETVCHMNNPSTVTLSFEK